MPGGAGRGPRGRRGPGKNRAEMVLTRRQRLRGGSLHPPGAEKHGRGGAAAFVPRRSAARVPAAAAAKGKAGSAWAPRQGPARPGAGEAEAAARCARAAPRKHGRLRVPSSSLSRGGEARAPLGEAPLLGGERAAVLLASAFGVLQA